MARPFYNAVIQSRARSKAYDAGVRVGVGATYHPFDPLGRASKHPRDAEGKFT